MILRDDLKHSVHGLTTAASIWLAACLGIACGLGFWTTAVMALSLTLFILIFGGPFERAVHQRFQRRDPLPRRLNAWAFFTLVTILFGRLARDVNCAFKLMRRDLLARMELHSEGALINTEVFVLARQLHARVVEVPIQHYPRTNGRQTGASVRVVVRAFSELLAFKAEMRKVEKAA